MKADMFTIEGKKTGSVELPIQCVEAVSYTHLTLPTTPYV